MACTDLLSLFSFFFFNDTATTEIYTLSLHDALPISPDGSKIAFFAWDGSNSGIYVMNADGSGLRNLTNKAARSEEHTSELQSRSDLVCRLLLEKKTPNIPHPNTHTPHPHHTVTHYNT